MDLDNLATLRLFYCQVLKDKNAGKSSGLERKLKATLEIKRRDQLGGPLYMRQCPRYFNHNHLIL